VGAGKGRRLVFCTVLRASSKPWLLCSLSPTALSHSHFPAQSQLEAAQG